MIRTKEDVEFHSEYGQARKPAVNVKVYKTLDSVPLPLDLGAWRKVGEDEWHRSFTEDGFTHEWIEENVSDDVLRDYEYGVLEGCWEELNEYAKDIWGKYAKVYSEGRSGGWAVVEGINQDVDSWDAVDLAKWRKFALYARALADDVPHRMLDSLYHNYFLIHVF